MNTNLHCHNVQQEPFWLLSSLEELEECDHNTDTDHNHRLAEVFNHKVANSTYLRYLPLRDLPQLSSVIN